MRFCERRTHEQTLQWAEQVDRGEYLEVYGITGKSVFFDAPGLDIVRDIAPETMHLLDGGFMKNTMGRTFDCGSAHQTRVGYRRVPITKLNDIIR